MTAPRKQHPIEIEEAALRGQRVRYHGSLEELHGEQWTVRGLCNQFDECEDDPRNRDMECGYEWGPRWMLIGPAVLGDRRQVIMHARRGSFTVLADETARPA